MTRFIKINMNVRNARMTYIVKRRKYMITEGISLVLLFPLNQQSYDEERGEG